MHETKAIVIDVAMNLNCHLVFIFSACLCSNSATVTFITRTNKVIPYFDHKIHLISQLLGNTLCFICHFSLWLNHVPESYLHEKIIDNYIIQEEIGNADVDEYLWQTWRGSQSLSVFRYICHIFNRQTKLMFKII